MTPTRIHHINFVVRDLDVAISEFEAKLGLQPFTNFDHAMRGSRIAKSRIGDTAFVLVCPYDEQSVPGRFLNEHGEGFFMLSLGVDDLDSAIGQLPEHGPVRDGIDGWRVADIGVWFGADLQLTDDRQ